MEGMAVLESVPPLLAHKSFTLAVVGVVGQLLLVSVVLGAEMVAQMVRLLQTETAKQILEVVRDALCFLPEVQLLQWLAPVAPASLSFVTQQTSTPRHQ
jgi:hypothetical protein